MTDPLLLIETADGVRTIRVNRPDKLNALNAATLDALDTAFAEAAADAAVRVVVLSGSGPKAFVAGADIDRGDAAERDVCEVVNVATAGAQDGHAGEAVGRDCFDAARRVELSA